MEFRDNSSERSVCPTSLLCGADSADRPAIRGYVILDYLATVLMTQNEDTSSSRKLFFMYSILRKADQAVSSLSPHPQLSLRSTTLIYRLDPSTEVSSSTSLPVLPSSPCELKVSRRWWFRLTGRVWEGKDIIKQGVRLSSSAY